MLGESDWRESVLGSLRSSVRFTVYQEYFSPISYGKEIPSS